MSPLLSRLLSPAGFVLVGLLFLLPFVGVSCSAPEIGSVDASYSGFDLVTGGDPAYEVDSPIADQAAPPGLEMPTPGVTPLAVAVLVLLLVGVGCALLARPTVRLAVAGGVAALAAVLLVVTEVVARSGLVDSIAEAAVVVRQSTSQNLDPVTGKDFLAGVVGIRFGFWVTLGALVVLSAGNLVAVRRVAARPR